MAAEACIFIPGIKGTQLVETNRPNWDTIWSGLQSNFETIEDLELTYSRAGSYYDEKLHTIIRPGQIEALAYGEFLRGLQKSADVPVFIFNYDWRLSAVENSERLDAFLKYLIEKSRSSADVTPFETFDFVTHSLGNFVLRAYLKRRGFARVNKIVFTVPPFRGSLDIVGGAIVGEGIFPNVQSSIRKIIRTMPGAMELLPTYEGASHWQPSGQHDFFRFNHWQGNIRDKISPVTEKLRRVLTESRKVVAKDLLDLSSLSPDRARRVLVIARDGFDTWQSLNVLKKGPGQVANFVDFENGLQTTEGDGRVPHVSSCHYWDSVTTLMVGDAFWYREYNHGFVLKDERVQKLVRRFLFGNGPFSWKLPGGSIRKVRGLVRRTDSAQGLPRWTAKT